MKEIIENSTNKTFIYTEKYVSKHFKDEYDNIIKYSYSNNLNNESWLIKLYCYNNNLKEKKICDNQSCNNHTKFVSYAKGFRKYCSKECILNEVSLDIRKKTNIDRYGVDNTSKLKENIIKRKKTTLERYGNEHFAKTNEFKEKSKKTNLERYGTDNPMSLDYIKEKFKRTNLAKYGVEHYSMTDDAKKRNKTTNLKKYGVDSYSKTNEFKEIVKNIIINNQQNEQFRKKTYGLSKNTHYIKYLGNFKSLFNCDNGMEHTFEITSNQYRDRNYANTKLCTICYPIGDQKSIKEKELLNYIKSIYDGKVISGHRDGLEIDIFLPNMNIGIEFNGIYWHSDKFLDDSYHLNKKNFFKEKGINIIYIWEDDWIYNQNNIKLYLLNILTEKKPFEDINYIISDYVDGDKIIFGISNNNLLGTLSLMKKENETYEIIEMTNYFNYKDLEFLLLNHFISKYEPIKIISIVDNDLYLDNIYKELNFKIISFIDPTFKYLNGDKRTVESANDKNYKIYNSGYIFYERIVKQ